MSDTTMERKLRLVQQVRSRYHENQYDLFNRERILYGKTSVRPEELRYDPRYDEAYGEMAPPADRPASTFKLRLWIGIFLILAVVYMDTNNMEVAGITAEKIYEVISADYEEKIEVWVETLSTKR